LLLGVYVAPLFRIKCLPTDTFSPLASSPGLLTPSIVRSFNTFNGSALLTPTPAMAASRAIVGVPPVLVMLRFQKGAVEEILYDAAEPERMTLTVPPVTV